MFYSIETFPPKSESGHQALSDLMCTRAYKGAELISVTCGAGGDGEQDTGRTVSSVVRSGQVVVPHITCGGDKASVLKRVQDGVLSGARAFLCLRGDAPLSVEGIPDVVSLISETRKYTRLPVWCAGYPDPHPESRGRDQDMAWMRRKWEAGASDVITQYVFDPHALLSYRDALAKAAPGLTLRPGVLPVRDLSALLRFSKRCGAVIPAWLIETLSRHAPGTSDFLSASADVMETLLNDLRKEGVDAVHVYALNDAALCESLINRGALTLAFRGANIAA